jgi:ornithine cyclodeaminase/alanine dehydrogenase-like protein (mu-crystallin family)
MIFLNEKEMWNSVSLNDVMDSIEEAYAIHKSKRFSMPDRYIAPRDSNMMIYMPCFTDEVIGTKMLAEFPENPSKGRPYLSGLMILNDSEHGQSLAIMDGGTLTAMRTGAVGGVGIKYLSPENTDSVGLAGCGVQGLHQLHYACAVRPIRHIYLYDAFLKDYQPFIEKLQKRLNRTDIQINVCQNSRELAENGQILISATQTADPVYPDDMNLLRGKTFIAVGSWRPERRELPDAVWKLTNEVYIDLPYACEESGDLKIPLESGILTTSRVHLLEDIIADGANSGRRSRCATQCFKSVGMGLFDVCAAKTVYRNALKKGIGQAVNF